MANRLCCFGVFYLFVLPCLCIEYNTVVTGLGKIKGVLVDIPGQNASVYQYRKIPYAQPPTGQFRFKKPVPISPWSGTIDATEFGPKCVQEIDGRNENISEDCLFVNVYVPYNTSSQGNLPVMVFIHGGGYESGSGQDYDGSYLTLSGNVILVTVNYRLGFLGFMSTGDNTSPGNYGLWDQHLALTWVRNNIRSFGGNSDQITIFGESAGGFSVALQSLYPGNKGVFHQAMAHSGVADSVFALSPIPKLTAFAIGKRMGCNKSVLSTSQFVDCLRSQSVNEINLALANASYTNNNKTRYVLPLGPVVDGDFVLDIPAKLLSNKSSPSYQFFRSLNFVVGNVGSEGSLILDVNLIALQSVYNYNLTIGIPSRILCDLIIPAIVNDYFDHNADVSRAICTVYSVPGGNDSNIELQSNKAVSMYSDFFFFVPSIQTLHAHADGNTQTATYQFLLTRNARFDFGEPYPHWLKGPGHFSEIPYLFGFRTPNGVIKQPDIELSKQMLLYWTNFARSGNPNNGTEPNINWSSYDTTSQAYIDLDIPITIKAKLIEESFKFWTQNVTTILQHKSASSATESCVTFIPLYAICSYVATMLIK